MNLAKRLEDQMAIVVPKVGEEAEEIPAGATSKEEAKEGKVNINTATVEELKTLKESVRKKPRQLLNIARKTVRFKQRKT